MALRSKFWDNAIVGATYAIPFAIALGFGGYVLMQGAETSGDFNFDPADIQYTLDPKTGTCFAATAIQGSKDIWGTEAGIGMTRVPCDQDVVKQIDSDLITQMRAKGIELKM